MSIAEAVIRDLDRTDYEILSKIIDDEWRFNLYSKKCGLEMATYYLLHCANGANVAKTVLVDGEPCGIMVIREMPGDTIDLSEDLQRSKDSLMHLKGDFERMEEDIDELHRIYDAFASKFKKPEWAELRLLILSDKHKGMGLGRRLMEEATKCASNRGMTGLFFYTDTDCNVGFYDHIGAVRIGQEDTICTGEPLTVFGYYLEFRPSVNKKRRKRTII